MKHIMLIMLAMLATLYLILQANRQGPQQPWVDIQQNKMTGQATMKVYDGEKLLFQTTTQGLSCVDESKFSSNGKWLLNIANDCGYVQLWDIRNKKRIETFINPNLIQTEKYIKAVSSYADFLPDGDHFLLSFAEKMRSYNDNIQCPSCWKISKTKFFWKDYSIKLLNGINIGADKFICGQIGYHGKFNISKNGKFIVFSDAMSYNPASVYVITRSIFLDYLRYVGNIPRFPYGKSGKKYNGAGAKDARLSPDGSHILVLYKDNRIVEYFLEVEYMGINPYYGLYFIKQWGRFNYEAAQKILDHFAETGH